MSLCVNKAYAYEHNLLVGVLSIALKLSPVLLSHHTSQELHYIWSMKKTSDIHSQLGLHNKLYVPLYLTYFDAMMKY